MRIHIGIESREYGSIGSCYKTPLYYFRYMETSSDKLKEYLNEHCGSGVIRMNNGFGDNFGSELFWNVTAG